MKQSEQTAEEGSAQEPSRIAWNDRKGKDVQGQQQQQGVSGAASRESLWRPLEPRAKQEALRSGTKPSSTGESAVDKRQELRSGTQDGAEPESLHKNSIRGRGVQRAPAEVRSTEERSTKSGAKGKKSREGMGPEIQSAIDLNRQRFEAGMRLKQEELLQKSKQSLKLEFQKAKRLEQARRGRDELETELTKNLVYKDFELFYLNL